MKTLIDQSLSTVLMKRWFSTVWIATHMQEIVKIMVKPLDVSLVEKGIDCNRKAGTEAAS